MFKQRPKCVEDGSVTLRRWSVPREAPVWLVWREQEERGVMAREVLKARVKNFAFVLITTVGGSRGQGWVGFGLYLKRALCSVKNGLKGPILEAGRQRSALRVRQ